MSQTFEDPRAYDQTTPATLHVLTCADRPELSLFWCHRCGKVTEGNLSEGRQTPCPQCSCVLLGCFTQKAEGDSYCPQHRRDVTHGAAVREYRRQKKARDRVMAKPAERLRSLTEQRLFDVVANTFYENFVEWAGDQLPWALSQLKADQHLLHPVNVRNLENPFELENLELMAEDAWGEVNPVPADNELQFVMKALSDLSRRRRPVLLTVAWGRRIDPYLELERLAAMGSKADDPAAQPPSVAELLRRLASEAGLDVPVSLEADDPEEEEETPSE